MVSKNINGDRNRKEYPYFTRVKGIKSVRMNFMKRKG